MAWRCLPGRKRLEPDVLESEAPNPYRPFPLSGFMSVPLVMWRFQASERTRARFSSVPRDIVVAVIM